MSCREWGSYQSWFNAGAKLSVKKWSGQKMENRGLAMKFGLFKYLKLLAQNDRRNFQNILKKKVTIESQRNQLKIELINKRKIINEKRIERGKLKTNLEQRNGLLSTIQQNKQTYLEKIRQYENSAKEIQRLILEEERKRIALENEGIIEPTDFPTLRGEMIWPTNGYVINHSISL